MGRSLKKGPFVDDHLMKKVEKLNESEKETSSKNLVTSFNNLPTIHWT